MSVRTTVYLDEAVLQRVRQHVPRRGLSEFINQTLAEKADELERKRVDESERRRIEALAIDGYLASRVERRDIDRDWEVVDLQGWPD